MFNPDSEYTHAHNCMEAGQAISGRGRRPAPGKTQVAPAECGSEAALWL